MVLRYVAYWIYSRWYDVDRHNCHSLNALLLRAGRFVCWQIFPLKRLNAYVSASASVRYALLTNGRNTRIYRRDFEYPRALQPIGDLPQYESAAEAAHHSPYTVILKPDEPDGIATGLTPLTRDKFREVLGDTRSGCHSILRDNEGLQPQEAVDAMVKFLFAKWYDEQATIDLAKQTGEARAYVFSTPHPLDPADPTYTVDKGQPGDLCPPCAKQQLANLGHWEGHRGQKFPEELKPLRLFKCRQWFWLVIPGLHHDAPSNIQKSS